MPSAARAAVYGLLLSVAAAGARAEDDCGRMVESLVRIHGTLQAVEPVGARARILTSVEYTDVRFAAVVAVDQAQPADAFQAGTTYEFGLHSPAQTLGTDAPPGSALELVLNVMHCDGKYRRLLGLRRSTDAVLEFDGSLEVGNKYRAEVRREGDDLVLVRSLRLPMHHMGGVTWTDVERARPPVPKGRKTSITFEVRQRETSQRSERQWLTLYDCVIAPGADPSSHVARKPR